LDVAQECGKRGARSLVVITSGLTPAQEASLLEASRQGGMGLVGPNWFGVALLEHLSRLGIGTSSFTSVGDMLDVSGNDMLMWWEADNATELAVLYLE